MWLLILVLFILNSLLAVISFDLLIYQLSKYHSVDWIKVGKPIGFFYIPRECSILWGSLVRYRISIKWLFLTPSWVDKDAKAAKVLLIYRVCGIFSFLWLPAFIIILILYS